MIVVKNMVVQQMSLRFSAYVQLVLDGVAVATCMVSWLVGAKPYIIIAGLVLLSLVNTFLCGHFLLCDLKRYLPNEEYQRLAARYFPYGNHWLWVMLQYKQLCEMTGKTGRMILRMWFRVVRLIAGSMLGIFFLFYLLTILI